MTWLDELVFTWVHIATPFAAHAKFASLAQIGPRRGVLSPTSLASSMWPSFALMDPPLTNLLRVSGAGCGDCSIHYTSGHGLQAE